MASMNEAGDEGKAIVATPYPGAPPKQLAGNPEPEGLDPVVVIATEALLDRWQTKTSQFSAIAEGDAVALLTALRDAGWRIVRTEGDEYAGEDVQITEEWSP